MVYAVRNRSAFVLLSGLVIAALPTLAGAAVEISTDTVFLVGPENQISVGLFDEGRIEPAITVEGTNFQGLAARHDGLLIVAKSTQGGGILVCDPLQGACETIIDFADAGGVAMAAGGDVLAVNFTTGGVDQAIRLVRDADCPQGLLGALPDCLPGGYASQVDYIDMDVQVNGTNVDLLADIKMVPFQTGRLELGDVVVLAQSPAMILGYRNNGSGWMQMQGPVVPEDEFGGLEPRGFAIDPNGDFLVVTKEGPVLTFSPDSSGSFAYVGDFVILDGSGAKIAVGRQAQQDRIFITVHNQGILQRYDFPGGALSGVIVNGVNAPEGVAIAAAASAPLPTGTNVTAFFPTLTQKFDSVVGAGQASVDWYEFVDPREDLVNPVADHLPLSEALDFQDMKWADDLPDEVKKLPGIIPAYVRAFKKRLPGDPLSNPSGPPTFRLGVTTNEARVEGVVELNPDELQWLSWEPLHCLLPGEPLYQESRTFYAPEVGNPKFEYPIVEGVFKDITIKCGHLSWSRGRGSMILDTVRDVRPVTFTPAPACSTDITSSDCDVISFKLYHLEKALTSSSTEDGLEDFIRKGKTKKTLEKLVSSASRAFEMGDSEALVEDLETFLSEVEKAREKDLTAKRPTFDESVTPVSAELRARAKATLFPACKLIFGAAVEDVPAICCDSIGDPSLLPEFGCQ